MKSIIFVCLFAFIAFTQGELYFEPAWPAANVVVPVDMVYQDNYVYVAGLTGTVSKFLDSDSPTNNVETFFDFQFSTSPQVSFYTGIFNDPPGEDGLASIAFHPRYPSVPEFYLFHSSSPVSIQITAWNVVNGAVDYASGDVLMTIAKPAALEARLGGDLVFDKNEDLYISVGDGSNSTAAQDLSIYLGKILRITPSPTGTGYTIPSSNPFFSIPKAKNEIYARGFRNPRKIAFAKTESKLFVGDVGNIWDEISQVDKAHNDGWDIYDGCQCTNPNNCPAHPVDFRFPFYQFTSANSHALTLGVYYPKAKGDEDTIESIENRLLFADLYSGDVSSIQVTDLRECVTSATFVAHAPSQISSFLRINRTIYISNPFGLFSGAPGFFRLVHTSE